MSNFDDQVKAAIEMLPKSGSDEEFDAYKARLLAANPANGTEVFRFMILNKLVQNTLKTGSDGKHMLVVSRPS